MALFQGSQAACDSSVRCPLLDTLIQELIPKLRGQFAFCCVPSQRRAGTESIRGLGTRIMGKEDLQDIDHPSQAFVWNSLPGDSLDFLSGPLHWGFLARILSGFRVLFIFLAWICVSCPIYCLCQVHWVAAGRNCLSDHLMTGTVTWF